MLLFVQVTFCKILIAQKTEINFNVYSGLFAFRGDGAGLNSEINSTFYSTPQKITANPYGKKTNFAYSFELQVLRILTTKYIMGLGCSFESLTSKININRATTDGILFSIYVVNGKTIVENKFINLSPFVGKRFFYYKVKFDITAGVDIAFCLQSKETGKAITNDNIVFTTNNNLPKPNIDFRPRLQLKTQYKKIGFNAGYSYGVTNYKKQNEPKVFTTFLRLGVSYQIK